VSFSYSDKRHHQADFCAAEVMNWPKKMTSRVRNVKATSAPSLNFQSWIEVFPIAFSERAALQQFEKRFGQAGH
jgi:hypothetical protein